MEDIKIHNAKQKANILKTKADLLVLEIDLLFKEFQAANEASEPLIFLQESRILTQQAADSLKDAAEILWD